MSLPSAPGTFSLSDPSMMNARTNLRLYSPSHEHQYDGLVIMTDGMADEPQIPKNFKCKILWVCEDKDAYDLSHKWMRKYGRVCYLPSV